MAEMKSPNVHAKKNRNDTPRKRKTHIIKVRVTAEEKLRIAYACKELHLTQSELVRRVLYGVNVKHTVVVAQGGEDALAALATLSAQCSKVGSNLNQLARHFNSGGKDTEQLRAQILEELSALTNFRLKAEETVGELYGNYQAFNMILSLRVGEILGLQPGDIDFDAAEGRGTITVGRSLQRTEKAALEKTDPNQIYHIFPDQREGSSSALVLKKPKTKKSSRTLYLAKPLKEELLAWLEKLRLALLT